MGEKLFKKSNNLIYAYSNGTLLANQLFAIGLQNIFIDEDNRAVSKMLGEDIKKELSLTSNSIYKRIRDLCDREDAVGSIYDWMIMYRDCESGKMIDYKVVSDASFSNGILWIAYNKEITNLIMNLSKNYTALSLSESMCLKTKNSYRLYEILKADYDFKSHEQKSGEIVVDYNLMELKLMLGDVDYKAIPLISNELEKEQPDYNRIEDIVDSKGFDFHKGYSKFNERVLANAVNEINEKTGLKVEYAPIKDGRAVIGVRFFIY